MKVLGYIDDWISIFVKWQFNNIYLGCLLLIVELIVVFLLYEFIRGHNE